MIFGRRKGTAQPIHAGALLGYMRMQNPLHQSEYLPTNSAVGAAQAIIEPQHGHCLIHRLYFSTDAWLFRDG